MGAITKKIAGLVLAAAWFGLLSGAFSTAQAWFGKSQEEKVLDELQDLEELVEDAWFFRYGRFTGQLKEVEEELNKLQKREDKNMSFFLAAQAAFRYYRAGQIAWRKADRSKRGRRYNISLRDGYFIKAADAVAKAETFFY